MYWSARVASVACPPPPLRLAAAAGDTSAEQRRDPSPGLSGKGEPSVARTEAVAVGPSPSEPRVTVQAEPSGEKAKEGARTSWGLRPLARRERWDIAWVGKGGRGGGGCGGWTRLSEKEKGIGR